MKYSKDRSGLFKLKSIHALARLLQSTPDELRMLASTDDFFKVGNCGSAEKPRSKQVPTGRNRRVHDRLFNLLRRIKLPDYVHLGPKGRSYITNAKTHVNTAQKYHVDISRYFPSTTWHKVYLFFQTSMECEKDIAALLASIATFQGHIPTGSPVSGFLAFWANRSLFDELERASKNHNLTMTLFQDDITFSGDKIPYEFRKQVLLTIRKHRLDANRKKTAFVHDFQPLKITGVIVSRDGIEVPAARYKKLKDRMERFKCAKSSEQKEEARKRLLGSMTEIENVRDKKFSYRHKFIAD